MRRHAFSTAATARRLEDVFLQWYAWLRTRALALVDGDRAGADDLVHDVFVELRLAGIDPDQIRNPEAYLFRTLRNIHISAIRRAARAPMRALSVVDYDSFDVLLADTRDDPARLLENTDDVRRVCAYACRRKETSKVGSALILRFFHGYTPQATATIMRVSAPTVDQLLSVARSEARVFLRDPEEDRGGIPRAEGGTDAGRMPRSGWSADHARGGRDDSSPDDLLVSLRRTILTTRQGACLSEGELAEWESAGAASVERQRLAHLVSCRVCIEAVAGRTGLPSPWTVSSDGDKGDHDGRWSGDTHRHWRKAKARPRDRSSDAGLARLQTVLEHRPRTLQIMVNGFLVGSQTVSHEPMTQTVQVGVTEAVGFIEVFADDRVRLLMMAVDPPPAGDIEQRLERHFGHGRALTVIISFAGPTPRISVTYEPAADEQVELIPSRVPLHPSRGHTEAPGHRGLPWFRWLSWNSWGAWPWGTAFAKAVAIVVVSWLLFAGGGGAALAAAAEHIAQAVRSWISSLTSPSVEKPADDDRRGLRVPAAPQLASTPPVAARPPKRAVALDAVTRAGVELDVLRALQPVHAYLGQEITIGSTADGKVLVEGLAADAARKRAVLAALRTLPTGRRRSVSFAIRTVDEAVRHAEAGAATSPDSRRAGSFRDYVVIADRFPAFDRVRAALKADVSTVATSPELDQRAHQFASRVLDVSRSASQHAAALQQIATRVTPAIAASLSASARASLTAVVERHADRFEHDLRTLGDELARVFDRPGTPIRWRPDEEESRDARAGSVLPMWALVDRMATLNATRVYAVSRAFSVSAEREADAGMVASGDFWALMDESIQVARSLRVP